MLLQTSVESVERLQVAFTASGWSPDQALFPVVFWVKSHCAERGELIHDALTHCCGVWAHTEAITSHPEPLALQESSRHSLAVYSHKHLPQSKQVGRNKPASPSGWWPVCHQGGMAVTCQCQLCQQVPILVMTAQVTSWPGPCDASPALGDLITAGQTVVTGDTLYVEKPYLGAIQRVLMYKCLHKLLRSNVTESFLLRKGEWEEKEK